MLLLFKQRKFCEKRDSIQMRHNFGTILIALSDGANK